MKLVMGLAAVGLLAATAQATDLPAEGGFGGNPYRVSCPTGAYLVGVTGYTGNWVDRMQLVCAPFSEGVLGRPIALPRVIGNSGGGVVGNALCGEGSAVYRVEAAFTRKDRRPAFLERLYMHCMDVQSGIQNPGPAHSPVLNSNGVPGRDPFALVMPPQICPDGELVVGLHGSADLFIDTIGLICGRVSKPSAPGNAMGRARSPAARALDGVAGSTVGAADNTRAAAQPRIGAQALQRQVDCDQRNAGAGSSAVGVSTATDGARPVAARCVVGTSAVPTSVPETAPAAPTLPDGEPPVQPQSGAAPPKPQVPRGRLSRDIHPGDRR